MRLVLLLALGALLTGSAAAKGEGSDAFTLVGHFSGGAYFWTFENDTVRNPDLVVIPNATITVRILNEGTQVHNLQVEGQGASAYVSSDAPETTHTFLSPASGTLAYWCQPHKASGMAGRVVVAGSQEEARPTPALGVLAILGVGVLLAFRRR